MNGLLLIGAPFGGGSFAFIFPIMVDYYNWRGAVLISIAVSTHVFILCPIYKSHPDTPITNRKVSFYNPNLFKVDGVIPFLIFYLIHNAFVLTPFKRFLYIMYTSTLWT